MAFQKRNEFWKKRKMTNEYKKKLSDANKEWHKHNDNSFKGKKHSEETKGKIREKRKLQICQSGENHHNWQGGKSFEPYTKEWSKQLKDFIRKRDKFRCQECFRHQDELHYKDGRKYKLHIHHIDYNKKNCSPLNLISLCSSCHHQTGFNRTQWTKYYMEKLSCAA